MPHPSLSYLCTHVNQLRQDWSEQAHFGTLLSQAAWLPILLTLGTHVWFGGRLMASRAHQVFDKDGNLTDEAVRKQLGEFIRGSVNY